MRRTIAVLLAAGVLVAAGCGDDDDDDGGGSGGATTGEQQSTAPSDEPKASGETTKVSLTDFKIDPAEPKLKAGKATFEVTNDGQVPHALEIEGNGEEFVSETLTSNGDTDTLEADLKAGEYEWYCPVGNHADMGMKGTLTVEGGSSSEGASDDSGGGGGGGY